MDIKHIKEYVEILKTKSIEILPLLREVNAGDTKLRDYVINFNNLYSNIQQYELLIKELEEEK